ncbi:FecR family protein [Chitinophaga flava]|uniref:FecR protein domain-containing protein n=1 Tax=Chitinophaga flava TaxID=2259036 RepID=A0A365Y030_9BACT|nr:FecR domain-containing protein [Chitinophaga flava]RBL91972.1 hypothetical protein DF182_05070 [Chitinophaga flava]
MMVIPDNIKAIIVNRLRGNISPEERKALEDWQCQQSVGDEELAEYDKVWEESGNLLSQPHFDIAKAWQCVDQQLKEARVDENAGGRVVRIRRYWRGAAAAAAIILVAAGSWLFFHQTGRQQVTLTKVTADATNKYFRLPDSSLVLLRKGATITYSAAFGHSDRLLTLSGDAFFDVAPYEKIPFRIQTERAVIKVLGTSFVVNNSVNTDRVVVVTGKIMFTDKIKPENKCIVSAKEEISITGHTLEKKNVSDSNYLAWQTGILRFTNTPLKVVVKELSSYYGKTIKLNDTLKTGSVTLTASFGKQPLKEVLEEIAVITGLQYRHQEDSVTIY